MVRRYSKLNFVDAVEIITPNVYIDQDRNVSGLEVESDLKYPLAGWWDEVANNFAFNHPGVPNPFADMKRIKVTARITSEYLFCVRYYCFCYSRILNIKPKLVVFFKYKRD